MKPKSSHRLLLVVAATALASAFSASAGILYWGIGNGDWNTTNTNWSTTSGGAASVSWPATATTDDDANFPRHGGNGDH